MDITKVRATATALLDRQREHNVSLVAAGLAFYGMLALVPALIALVSVYGLVSEPQEVARQIADLTETLPESTASFVQEQLVAVTGTAAGGLGLSAVIAVLVALWSTSGAMAALIKAIGIAWGDRTKRSIVQIRGAAFAMTIITIVAVAITLGLTVLLPAWIADLSTGLQWFAAIVRWVLLFGLALVALTLIYRFAPTSKEKKAKVASAGALFATSAIVLGTILFSVYVGRFGSFNETYGTLAGIVVLLLWLYLCGFAVVLGAELDAHLGKRTRR